VRHLDNRKALDPTEVIRIASEKRKVIRNRDRGDHGVKGARRRFSARAPQRGGHAAEGSRGRLVKRQRIKVRLGLMASRPSRSASEVARSGPTDNSASVIVESAAPVAVHPDPEVAGEAPLCSCPGARLEAEPQPAASDGGIDDSVQLSPEPAGIHSWQTRPAPKQGLSRKATAGQWPQLGDWLTVSCHGDLLPSGHAVYDLSAMVAKVTNRNLAHGANVSRVIHTPIDCCRRLGGTPQLASRKVRDGWKRQWREGRCVVS
jgi:hypothetical protein